ncbi:MAG: Putative inner membrane or exported protein [uncultured Sulfurovum sp.]|uniref:Inner membrane or exported protein n=1 Tax=uncultured Sulfurovum sp. TaxID=269237 RepID=A0A6S6UH17_9BACT|nr:MAG: Putative inner membrane or exported protein [uncultured Sulfurovum sp.]
MEHFMKNLLLGLMTFILMFIFSGCENKKGTFLEIVNSQNSHEQSVLKLQNIIRDQGLTLFDTIDHQANATTVKLDLKPTTVVVFGNPKMGTVLMNCNPTMGLELPLRILISTDYEGLTTFTYTNPEYWSLKHNIKDKNCLSILQKAKGALADLTEKSSQK